MRILWVLMTSLAVTLQSAHGQYQQPFTTPVPILKQIDRHNDDGSYTFGYEAADKSFKIETKYPNGEVFGKYGYLDDQGKVREIEYGASKRGFEPAGSDINVPPPTLTNNHPYPLGPNELDDGQYREDPGVYYKNQKYNQPIATSKFSLNNNNQQHQQPRLQSAYNPPTPQYYNPGPTSSPRHYTQPQPEPQPQSYQTQPYQPQESYQQPQQPQYSNKNYNGIPNHHHPAVKNLNIWSGSYSIDYTGRK